MNRRISQREKYYGVAAAALVTIVWSGWFIISKWGVANSLTNPDILLLRFATASAVVSPLLLRYKLAEIPAIFRPQVMLVSLAVGVPYVWLSLTGLEEASTAQAGVLVNGCLPIFTLVLLYFVASNKPSMAQVIGSGIILLGNVILITGNESVGGLSLGAFGYPQMLLLGASLCMAIYTLGNVTWNIKLQEIMIVAPITNLGVTSVVWLAAGGWQASAIASAPLGESLLQALYQGVLVSVIVLWLMGTSLKYISGQAFALIMALVPIITPFLAFITLGEGLSVAIIGGAALCVIGIAVVNTTRRPPHRRN